MEAWTHRGITLQYLQEGSGVPLLFLHGMGGSVRQIQSVYDAIPGVSLLTMNQQGHGGSGADWTDYSFSRLAEDALSLLDHLGIEKACFAGISMGAAVSLAAALRAPERVLGLGLIRNAWTHEPMAKPVRDAYWHLGEALKQRSIDAFYASAGWETVSQQSPYTRNAFLSTFQDEDCLKNWQKYQLLPPQTPFQAPEELKRLHMPVVVLANRNDFCHPFAYGGYMKEHIPGAELREIPDKDADAAGHRQSVNDALRYLLSLVYGQKKTGGEPL